jgi:hypothetical protein
LGKKGKWLRAEMDQDYDLLSEDYKEDNRAAAARIPKVLDLVGLYVVPKSYPRAQSVTKTMQIINANIEILAEAEHNDWMAHKIKNGWVFGEPRDDSNKVHDCLRAYAELSNKDKEKDRNSVRRYPDILKEADYKIVSSLT